MRLALIHGINNQNSSSEQIIEQWLQALGTVLNPDEMREIRSAEIVAPYYGDVLFHESTAKEDGPQAIAQSAANPLSDEAEFYRHALEDFAPAVGVTETDVRAYAGFTGPIEQGLPHDRRFLALLRAIEAIAPDDGRIFLRLLPQAFTYLYRQHVTDLVDEIVRPALGSGPTVVVAHSLGTIVTFKLLRENSDWKVPSYVTLGSPLGVKAVQNALGPVFGRPECAAHWLNALDPNDAVTIGRSLKETTFGSGVENIDDVNNGRHDPHDISMYLHDDRVAQIIARTLRG